MEVYGMRFGLCCGMEELKKTIESKADYIECRVVDLMKIPETELLSFGDELKNSPIQCEVLSVLFPGREIPLAGEDADMNKVEQYINHVLDTLYPLFKPEIVVFGSGGARSCPDGFDREKAHNQLIEAGKTLAQAAEKYNVTVALEPLNLKESNMVNSITEAVDIVKKVNRPNFKITADIYHMMMGDEPPDVLYPCEGLIAHTHIATNKTRLYPQEADRAVLTPYFKALREIGYNKRMSIEAGENGSLKDSFDFLGGL
jgi:sugar phosphate isomerase/epimerase